MKTIIGLGQAGCSIAEKFKKYPQYKVYKIDVGLKEAGSYAMKRQTTPELYESRCPNLKTFFKEVSNEVLFITSSGDISGASLRILEQLGGRTIGVLYVKPDMSLLSMTEKLQENVVFRVLQEYARSSVFEKIFLADNAQIAEVIGDVPIKEHYNYLNEVIVSTIHMINVFDNSKSVLDNFSQPMETARIFTFGLVNFEEEESEEKMFFDLQMPREKKYYYAYPEEIIESDGTLMKKIKKHIKKNTEHDKMKISYGIYSTNYEQPYVYCVSSSTLVQTNEKILDK